MADTNMNASEIVAELEDRGEAEVVAVWHNERMADSVWFDVVDVQLHNQSGQIHIVLEKK